MVPLGTLVDVHETTGPDKVIRYNMYPAADINGVALPGVSSGQAIALAQQLAAKELPPGMSYEWTELTLSGTARRATPSCSSSRSACCSCSSRWPRNTKAGVCRWPSFSSSRCAC